MAGNVTESLSQHDCRVDTMKMKLKERPNEEQQEGRTEKEA